MQILISHSDYHSSHYHSRIKAVLFNRIKKTRWESVLSIYFDSEVTKRDRERERGGREKDEEGREEENARSGMAGWTNSIVVERLTAIGQRYIQLPGLTRAWHRNTITNCLCPAKKNRPCGVESHHHSVSHRINFCHSKSLSC